jgi:hypothetical protein
MTTVDQQLREYQSQGYNVLLPSSSIQRVSEFHDTVLEVVPLSITCGDAYPYDDRHLDKAKKFGIAKPGLLKLSHAAGIVWRWEATQRIDQLVSRDYVAYQAVGSLRQADGTWIDLKGSYELDLEVIEQDLRTLYTKIGRSLQREDKLKSDEAVQAYIANNVQQELLRKRKHKLRLAETGAMLAVIRSLLAMKSLYTREELDRPFVVPRVVFSPNLSDPEIRKAILASSLRAVHDLYGVPVPQPVKTAIALPPANPDDTDETLQGESEAQASTAEGVIAQAAASLPDAALTTAPTSPSTQHPVASPSVPPHTESVQHAAPAVTVPQRAPAEVPPTAPDTVPQLHSLEDFAACPRDRIPAALRALMQRKGFKASLLTNPTIEDWTHEQHRGFVKMLLGRRDVGPAATTGQAESEQTRPAA